ncbi:hypothetical protein N566_27425 [Streptomycetaceae bacterium MP113-05]|nr:hypothetical protein N566_27425 [Streptomycetaceae bacterium MP113-05]
MKTPLPVKENRPALFAQLDALDWDETTNEHVTVVHTEETNSGRHERRIVRVQPLTDGQMNFPPCHPRPPLCQPWVRRSAATGRSTRWPNSA